MVFGRPARRARMWVRPRHQIALAGCHHYGFLVHITAVAEHLVADEADVLERLSGPRCVKDEHVGGCLSQATVGNGRRLAPALQIPLCQRVFRELVHGREIGDVDVDDPVVGHEAALVAPWVDGRVDTIAELVADKLLQKFRNKAKQTGK